MSAHTSLKWPTLLAVLATMPFLMADSCIKQVFNLHEYALDHCPPTGFELPAHVNFAGWDLRAEEQEPYCHGFTRYRLDEQKQADAFSEPIKGAFIYARLRVAQVCTLELISNLSCNPRESIEDCERRMPYHGAHPHLKAGAGDYTDVIAHRLLTGQKFSPKLPALKATQLGRFDALEAWCKKH